MGVPVTRFLSGRGGAGCVACRQTCSWGTKLGVPFCCAGFPARKRTAGGIQADEMRKPTAKAFPSVFLCRQSVSSSVYFYAVISIAAMAAMCFVMVVLVTRFLTVEGGPAAQLRSADLSVAKMDLSFFQVAAMSTPSVRSLSTPSPPPSSSLSSLSPSPTPARMTPVLPPGCRLRPMPLLLLQIRRVMARFTKASMVSAFERWVDVLEEEREQRRKMTRFIQVLRVPLMLLLLLLLPPPPPPPPPPLMLCRYHNLLC